MNKEQNQLPINHFEKSFHYNFLWSLLYESLRIIHNLFLIKYLSQITYGLIGTIFATIYLVVKCIDMGTAYTIAPFFLMITQDKKQFKRFIFLYSILPIICCFVTIITGISLFFAPKYHDMTTYTYLLPIIIGIVFIETFRSFFRQLLHIAFKSRSIIITEFLLFIGYLLAVWIPCIIFNGDIDVRFFFLPFLIDGILALLFSVYKTYQLYQSLPLSSIPTGIVIRKQITWFRIFRARITHFFLRMSKDLCTTNILTPLFALKFGLKSAGIFYLVSTIAMAVQTIIKAAIGHSGNALLANVKDQSVTIKQEAFSMMSKKFLMVILVLFVAILTHFQLLLQYCNLKDCSAMTSLFTSAYLLITLSDLIIVLYEYFYILEESMIFLCLIRITEFSIFYFTITHYGFSPSLVMLITIFSIRIISLLLVALYAYFMWKLIPRMSFSLKEAGGFLITLLLLKSLTMLLLK